MVEIYIKQLYWDFRFNRFPLIRNTMPSSVPHVKPKINFYKLSLYEIISIKNADIKFWLIILENFLIVLLGLVSFVWNSHQLVRLIRNECYEKLPFWNPCISYKIIPSIALIWCNITNNMQTLNCPCEGEWEKFLRHINEI